MGEQVVRSKAINIFFLDLDTTKCAKDHCDKHVVKMILETAQLLCSAHHVTNSNLEIPYRLTHKNHPCSIWVRKSLSNYLYLCELGLALCKEYTNRYGKKHKTQTVIEWCVNNKPDIKDIGFTEPAKAMPDEFKTEDIVTSYRNYYRAAKMPIATWKNGHKPVWI